MILITGGAGFIGPKLAERLVMNGELVRVFDDLSTGALSNISNLVKAGGVEFVKGDIRDAAAVFEAARGCEKIYHLAAQSSVQLSTENPRLDMDVNINGTLNALEAARSEGCRLIFASSSVVYGRAERRPTPEGEPLMPSSFYGVSKMAAESYCRIYSELFGVQTVSLRLFNIYGPGTNKGVMIDLYRRLLREPSRIEVLGSGRQTKDYLYVDDAVDAFLRAPERSKCKGEAYNIGLGESYSVLELAGMMTKLLGLQKVEVTARGGVAWPGDVELTQPDVGLAEREIGWKAKAGIMDGLRLTLKWFEKTLGPIAGSKLQD